MLRSFYLFVLQVSQFLPVSYASWIVKSGKFELSTQIVPSDSHEVIESVCVCSSSSSSSSSSSNSSSRKNTKHRDLRIDRSRISKMKVAASSVLLLFAWLETSMAGSSVYILLCMH